MTADHPEQGSFRSYAQKHLEVGQDSAVDGCIGSQNCLSMGAN